MFYVRHIQDPCAGIFLRSLVYDPPANKTAIHKRKFPAATLRPGILGWLCHTIVLCGHLGLLQMVVTTASVPIAFAFTKGLSTLQEWQNWNSKSSCDSNTMCLGSVRRLPSTCNKL